MNPLVKNYEQETAVVQYRFIKAGTADGLVKLAADNQDKIIGISSDYVDSGAGNRVDVTHFGIGLIQLGDTVAFGDLLTTDADGKAVTADDDMVDEETIYSGGVALESGVAGDIIEMLVIISKLSKLDGVTADSDELNVLDGVTAGTAAASKGVVLDSEKHIDEVNTTKLSLGASGAAVEVTATAAELNTVADVTPGTAAASKAVVLNSAKHVDEVNTTKLSIGASGAAVEVTATAAELNLNDLSAQTETITEAGAVSVVKKVTKITESVGTYAITLDVPNAAMLGQIKIIEMTANDSAAVTMALTNVVGGSQAASASFDAVGEALVLVAGVSKWIVLKEIGVTLS